MFPARMWSWGLMTLSLQQTGLHVSLSRASSTSLYADRLSSPSGAVAAVTCLVFKPGDVLLRSYPKNDDDDDAKELVFLDGRVGGRAIDTLGLYMEY
ncbi:hypothetical protein ACSS6W_004733 [Trichoderma asperelloides]|nr:hypothetical protein LI328DRAFT_28265 [Trichoderma asperelloides]